MFETIPTPTLLLDIDRVEDNIARMQRACDEHDVQLWPHIKTHKMVEVARRQLSAGAMGPTCAKLSEAEAMLPSGVRRLFLAHSLVDPLQIPRLQRLAGALDELIVACTSELHAPVLEQLLAQADLKLSVLMAVDTGLGREGVRELRGAIRLAEAIRQQPHLDLRGLYTHEGHIYSRSPAEQEAAIAAVHEKLLLIRDAIDPHLELWPGCSVTAARMAAMPEITVLRPGAYVFGDMSLCDRAGVMTDAQLAVTVLATVVDRPEAGLALIDAGSKVFSGDKTPEGISARCLGNPAMQVIRCNEEHGYLAGDGVNDLNLRDRLRFVPAHICATINLADSVTVIRGNEVIHQWRVDARGCVQ